MYNCYLNDIGREGVPDLSISVGGNPGQQPRFVLSLSCVGCSTAATAAFSSTCCTTASVLGSVQACSTAAPAALSVFGVLCNALEPLSTACIPMKVTSTDVCNAAHTFEKIHWQAVVSQSCLSRHVLAKLFGMWCGDEIFLSNNDLVVVVAVGVWPRSLRHQLDVQLVATRSKIVQCRRNAELDSPCPRRPRITRPNTTDHREA